jgi:hypothetical protein
MRAMEELLLGKKKWLHVTRGKTNAKSLEKKTKQQKKNGRCSLHMNISKENF